MALKATRIAGQVKELRQRIQQLEGKEAAEPRGSAALEVVLDLDFQI